MIHHDCNEYNILMNSGKVGIIDFGDMMHAPRVFEMGVAIAYCLINVSGGDEVRLAAA